MICIFRDSLDDRWKRITNFQIYQLNYHACLILHGIFQYFPSDRFCGSCNSSIYWKIWCTNNSHLSTIEVSLLCTKTEKRSSSNVGISDINWYYILILVYLSSKAPVNMVSVSAIFEITCFFWESIVLWN